MSILPKSVLKAYFETGDKPTQAQFYSLIDSFVNFIDDKKYLGFKIYNTTIGYEPGDITVYNGLAYQAIALTSGAFDPAKWIRLDLDVDIMPLTYAELATLKSTATLKAGQFYFITDRSIWIHAITTDRLSLSGCFMAINADYQNVSGNNVGVWNAALTGLVANTSVAIWDNLNWLNLTGDVGTQPNGDGINWDLQSPTSDPTYAMEIDDIKYDFDLDFIFERSDKRGNFISTMRDIDGSLGLIPMEFFQWGRDGVDGNFIKNSVFNNINCIAKNFSVHAIDFSFISVFDDANCSNGVFSGASIYTNQAADLQKTIIRNFSITAIGGIVSPGKRLEPGFSNFELSLDVTGVTTLDLNGMTYGGIFNLSSGNGAETFSSCNNPPTQHPFELRPANGLVLDITNGTGSPGEFALPMATISLDGSKGDYAKFRVDANGVIRLTEFMNYF